MMQTPRRGRSSSGRIWVGGPQDNADQTNQRELTRLQNQNNGLDVEGLTRVSGVEDYQEPLPGLDLLWLSQSDTQAYFALTIKSFRGGLEMQRGSIEEAHLRQAMSEGVISHSQDELILSFDIESQASLQTPFNNYNMLHVNFLDREIMCAFLGSQLYVETSGVDPTIIQMPTGSYAPVYSLAVVRFGGRDYLAISTTSGIYFRDGIETSTQTGPIFFRNQVAPESDPFGGKYMLEIPGAGGGSHTTVDVIQGWNWRNGQTAESFIPQNVVQSPVPGSPLIARSSTHVIQVPTQDENGAVSFTQPCAIMQRNVGLGNSQPLGWLTLSGMTTRLYYWETNTGGPASNSVFKSRLTSVDASGYRYRVHELSLPRILGCAPMRQLGAVAIEDGYHVVLWNGRERDLGLFADEPPTPGFTLFCVGLHELEGQLVAAIAELPSAGTSPLGAGIGEGRIRTCMRRYDFGLRRWFQLSEWTVLTENGHIRWTNGVPIPVGNTANNPQHGFMPAYGSPDLPWGKVTRYLHNHMMPARYTYNLGATLSLPPAGSFTSTWYRKFEPPASVNAYSYRGSKPYTDYGRTRTPGLIFPGRSRWANKYFDAIEYLGQDTGGPGSLTRISLGEYGHLDDVNSDGLRPLISREFSHDLNHAQRRMPLNNNLTPTMIPQIEAELLRDDDAVGSDNTLTQQALPFTLYGHVDFVPITVKDAQESFGRSKA